MKEEPGQPLVDQRVPSVYAFICPHIVLTLLRTLGVLLDLREYIASYLTFSWSLGIILILPGAILGDIFSHTGPPTAGGLLANAQHVDAQT